MGGIFLLPGMFFWAKGQILIASVPEAPEVAMSVDDLNESSFQGPLSEARIFGFIRFDQARSQELSLADPAKYRGSSWWHMAPIAEKEWIPGAPIRVLIYHHFMRKSHLERFLNALPDDTELLDTDIVRFEGLVQRTKAGFRGDPQDAASIMFNEAASDVIIVRPIFSREYVINETYGRNISLGNVLMLMGLPIIILNWLIRRRIRPFLTSEERK